MIVRLPFILFWLLTSTCVIGAKQHGIKDVGPQLPALVSYKIIHKAFNDESSTVYLAQTHDLHTSADQKHLSNSAEFNNIAAKQSPIPFLAYCVATNKTAKEAAKAQFRKEAAGLETKVIRSGRDGTGKIVGDGTGKGGPTYRPKPDGSYSVGKKPDIKHYRPTSDGGHTVNQR
jgi:hypothetical protein